MVLIVVHGTAEHEHPAERGVVEARIEVEGPERAEVAGEAARLHAILSSHLEELESVAAVTRWSADSVGIGLVPEYRNDGSRGPDRHRAGAGFSARFTDFSALGQWLGALAELAGVRINGVSWDLSAQRREAAIAESRRDAVGDARARADLYAAAAGLGQPSLLRLYEPGLRPGDGGGGGGGPYAAAGIMRASADMMGGGPEQSFDLTPRPIVIAAEITADFEA